MSEKDVSTKAPSLGELMDDDEIIQQKSWQFIRQLNSASDDLLDAPALIGGSRTYTYRQMFEMWDRYAEVFSALGITGENHARVVLLGSSSVEPIFALYALNMCGASVSLIMMLDFLNEEGIERMIAEERITDIVVPDYSMPPDFFFHLAAHKEQLGIRNIVVLPTSLADPLTPPVVIPFVWAQRELVRSIPGSQLMDNLLVCHVGHPISYGTDLDASAFITHASGTTKGIHKPVPLSDVGVNEGARRLLRLEEWRCLRHNIRVPMGLDLMLAYTFVDMVHAPLAAGGTVVTMFVNCLNPRFFDAVRRYDVNVLMTTSFMLDAMEARKPDLSSVEVTFVGGSYVSPTAKQHYDDVVRQLGAKQGVSIGYGLPEACGVCVLASADRTDDAMGYLLPGVEAKILDEDEGVFYDLDDGPRTGVLFLKSPSVSSGRVDDKIYFTLDEIDGEPYLNTFDLVRVNEDGSLTHAGRMNRYFVNDDGVRFDAGLVEGAVSAQPHVLACGIGPKYDRMAHDTVPVLYVQVEDADAAGVQAVRDALVAVFVTDGAFEKTNLPVQCMIMDSIPRNAAGKVDVRAAQGSDKGERFRVLALREDDRLVDVRLEPADDAERQSANVPSEVSDMLMAYAQMAPWFVPGGHTWYTMGDTEQKRQALEWGVSMLAWLLQQQM